MLPTQKSEPKTELKDLTTLIYGASKIGKSTWCSNAEDALFLSTEPGLKALKVFEIPIKTWSDFKEPYLELRKGDHNFKTIIIDTIDNAYLMCAEHVCKKAKIEHESDLGYGKAYALINNNFQRFITQLAFLPYGLIMTSHSCEKDFQSRIGIKTKTIPTLPDKPRKIVTGLVDLILFCETETKLNKDGKTISRNVMRTKPTENYDAGDRTGKLPETIPLDYPEFIKAFEGKDKIVKKENK